MANMGRFNVQALKDFQKELEKINNPQTINVFLESCAKELAARLFRIAVKRTPTGKYPKSSGKKGGTLKRGWTFSDGGNNAMDVRVNHYADTYVIEIVNPVEYASYVEYGHRTANGKGWVNGRYMMTLSEKDLNDIAPKILERKIKKFLGGVIS